VTTRLGTRIGARIDALVQQYDGGDRSAAARRLGIEPEHLAGLLSGDWRRFTLDALAALVHGYSISLNWLLAPGGRVAWPTHAPRMPPPG
jgi:hypothetical protein